MKLFAVVLLTLASFALAQQEEEKYDDKYDYLDVDGILKNDRLRQQYLDCFLETKPCVTADAIFIKKNFPEAVVTKCRKCTEAQKMGFEKLINWMTKNDPETWRAILRKSIEDFTKKGNERRAKEKGERLRNSA
uniref:Chemosensory protein 2 n=1 Tax=Encarsia formosa TaxID=32400 RepID=A0A6M5CIX9_ENCFO|nr:chemosensory protein 2 [Encarsia formosa]